MVHNMNITIKELATEIQQAKRAWNETSKLPEFKHLSTHNHPFNEIHNRLNASMRLLEELHAEDELLVKEIKELFSQVR